MIKAIVMDIDGVIVGTRQGYNLPIPSEKVQKILHTLSKKLPISFCSAKSFAAVINVIKACNIDNIHITDGGSLLHNPFSGETIFEQPVHPNQVLKVIELAEKNDYSLGIFTKEACYTLETHSKKLAKIGYEPVTVTAYTEATKKGNIIKITLYIDKAQKNKLESILPNYILGSNVRWSGHPAIPSLRCLVITEPGVSKHSGYVQLLKHLNIHESQVLGIGDTMHDWEFIELCGYKATMANASKELKNKFDFSDKHQFMGGHVDEDGVLDIFKHFKLTQ